MTQRPKDKSGAMTAKLDTVEGVLEWTKVARERLRGNWPKKGLVRVPADTATAAFLAECVRLRQAFDEAQAGDARPCRFCNEPGWTLDRLDTRAALDEGGGKCRWRRPTHP